MKKKTLYAVIISTFFVFAFTMFNASASEMVAEGEFGENITWQLDDEGLLYISGTGDMPTVSYSYNIPWYNVRSDIKKAVIDEGITSIGKYAFYYCSEMTSITIPDSVSSSKESAFYGCDSLSGIYITNLKAYMNIEYSDVRASMPGYYAKNLYLDNELLVDVVIPEGVSEVTSYIFWGNKNIKSVVFPDSVTKIDSNAFQSCSELTSVTLPENLTTIGYNAFYLCNKLTDVYITDLKAYMTIDVSGVAYPTYYAKNLYLNNELITELVIPDGVTTIPCYVFRNNENIVSVTVSDSVKEIVDEAFSGCTNLTDVNLGNKLETIGERAFSNSAGTENLIIPDSVTHIGEYAFNGWSNLKNVTFGNSVISVGEDAFEGCNNLENVYVSSVENWVKIQFKESQYSNSNANPMVYAKNIYIDSDQPDKIVIPEGTDKISPYAFYNWSFITEIDIPDSVTAIGQYAFANCYSLTRVNVEGINTWLNMELDTEIDGEKIYIDGEKPTNIVVPEGITSISDNLFYNWKHLESISLPVSLTSIGQSAFNGCVNLDSVYIQSLESWLGVNMGGAYFSSPMIYAEHIYINNEEPVEIIVPEGTVKIGKEAFCGWKSVKKITLPDSIESIGRYAFYQCSSLESINIPKEITTIPKDCFGYCGIKSITIPGSVITIEEDAFFNCNNLESVYVESLEAWLNIDFDGNYYHWYEQSNYANPMQHAEKIFINGVEPVELVIPDNVASIKNGTFYNWNSLTKVVIPDSITNLGSFAFYSCDNLEDVEFGNGIDTIQQFSFYRCQGLTSITIPDNVNKIERGAFKYCANLSNINMTNSTKTIEDEVFSECENITVVNYNGSKEEWNATNVGTDNLWFTDANVNCFQYVNLIGEDNEKLSYTCTSDSVFDFSVVPEKKGYSAKIYTDETLSTEFDINAPITANTDLYLVYEINQYSYKFLDEDGTVLKEETVDYKTVIVPPETPVKEKTQQYTYTFAEWTGYEQGMTQENREMVFVAKYDATVNQYTYKFLDEDGSVIKQETVDYETVIIPPEISDKAEYYLFDYWKDYTQGMAITEDLSFIAVYKYKKYVVTAEGIAEGITVTYNSNYAIEPQVKDGYNFIGYFTETAGKGIRITDGEGVSLSAYNMAYDISVYPYFEATHLNKIELQGAEAAMPGDAISQRAVFAIDKDAMYLMVTVKYPRYLELKNISTSDFAEASKGVETEKDGFKYLDVACIYDYNGGLIEKNKNLVPFVLEFDIMTDAPIGEGIISIEKATLMGGGNYEITDITNKDLIINPKLAESIEITGDSKIDKATEFVATVIPDYTTYKAVLWSVDKEDVASISQDGVLTPLLNGIVTITATAKDGSQVFATKTVEITAYAKIDNIDFGEGIPSTDFSPDNREYVVYVKEDVKSITLTPTHSAFGVVRPNGSGVWFSGMPMTFELPQEETIITLNREFVDRMTNSIYTIKVVKLNTTKTEIEGENFNITVNPAYYGKMVFLVLYNEGYLTDVKYAVCERDKITFTSNKEYTDKKVMILESVSNMRPVCAPEIID